MSRWHNRGGYVLQPYIDEQGQPQFSHGRKVYEFFLGWRFLPGDCNPTQVPPLTFEDDARVFWQPDRHGITDLGSIPQVITPILPINQHEQAYILHDSACRERGLYRSETIEGPFKFQYLPSATVHKMLFSMCLADGAPRWRAAAISYGVRVGGPHWHGPLVET